VAMGFAAVHGSSKLLKDKSADDEEEGPSVRTVYDKAIFDAENKVFFSMARKPPANRCYYCHTNFSVDQRSGERWTHEGDIHIINGMSCTDCHRNAVDHAITRGYEGEFADRKDKNAAVETLTCKGCHLGAETPGNPATALGGKLGSPKPLHAGLPPVHLEKLSCTACHSGPWPQETPQMVQTSLAHALGLDLPARKPETLPQIVQPVFLRLNGKITPHKVVWPNFWGKMEGEKITPIAAAKVKEAAGMKCCRWCVRRRRRRGRR